MDGYFIYLRGNKKNRIIFSSKWDKFLLILKTKQKQTFGSLKHIKHLMMAELMIQLQEKAHLIFLLL